METAAPSALLKNRNVGRGLMISNVALDPNRYSIVQADDADPFIDVSFTPNQWQSHILIECRHLTVNFKVLRPDPNCLCITAVRFHKERRRSSTLTPVELSVKALARPPGSALATSRSIVNL